MKDNLATIDPTRALSEKRARKAAADIHALNTAEQIAERVKDPTAVERALAGKLEAQRDFAAEYKAMFPHGGNRGQDDSTVILNHDWCDMAYWPRSVFKPFGHFSPQTGQMHFTFDALRPLADVFKRGVA